jgi:hypothetical protein
MKKPIPIPGPSAAPRAAVFESGGSAAATKRPSSSQAARAPAAKPPHPRIGARSAPAIGGSRTLKELDALAHRGREAPPKKTA